jgi:hypothetical protein
MYMDRYVSDHGKMYVGVSRVKRPDAIKMLIMTDTRQGYNTELKQWYTHNPVQRQLWDLSMPVDTPFEAAANPHGAVYRADAEVRLNLAFTSVI